MKWLISMFTVMVLIVAAPNAQAIDNGSFETGDLTGWTTVLPAGGTAGAVTSHADTTPGVFPPVVPGVTSCGPTDGSYFALIKTNGPGSLSQLYQVFTVPPGAKATLTLAVTSANDSTAVSTAAYLSKKVLDRLMLSSNPDVIFPPLRIISS